MDQNAPRRVVAISGTVGKAPTNKQTSKGQVVNFSVAVKNSYDEGAQDTWFDVSVWNEGLQASVIAEVYKGAKVAVEGTHSTREYEGKTYHQISGARVGLVDFLSRSARTEPWVAAPVAAPAAPAPAPIASRDPDDLPF